MTWSAHALFSVRGTEFAFNIGNFLIILPFHSLSATVQVYIFLNIWSILKSLFWMKQIQGSVTVKINEYVHSWSEFLCVSVLLIFNFFPKLTIFTILRLYMACKMWKITALTWEISSWRLVKKIPYLPFHVLFSILLDCGTWNYKTTKNIFALNPEKKDTKTSTKRHEWNGMTQNELFDIFSNAQA